MKKPIYPEKDLNLRYYNEFKDTSIFSKIYVGERIEEDIDDFIDELKDGDPDAKIPEIVSWKYKNQLFSLKDILDKVPPGIDPENIIIFLDNDSDYFTVSICERVHVNKKDWDKKSEEYNKEFEEKIKIYNEEMKFYDRWKLEQEILESESKLKELKKKHEKI